MATTAERVEEILRRRFEPAVLELEDETSRHRRHAGFTGKSHFALRIVAAEFEGRSRIERHRLVFDALGSLVEDEIHALSVRALAPSEWTKPSHSRT